MNRLFFLALVAISLTSCNLLEIFRTTQPYNDCYWYIKNVTSEPVCVRDYSNDGTEPINILLDKGDSVELFFYGVDIRCDFRFDILYNNDSYHENNYLRVEVLSEAGELLKTWPLIETEASGDRFYEGPRGASIIRRTILIFGPLIFSPRTFFPSSSNYK